MLALVAVSGGTAFAKGGTAKPPPNPTPPPTVTPTLPAPTFSGAVANLHGFDDTGFIQSATVDAASANCSHPGGTVTMNNVKITIPCNLIVQMPANTVDWSQFVNGLKPGDPQINGFPSTTAFNSVGMYGSVELHLVGNMVGASQERIAGLAFASQQSVNSGSGTIASIDNAKGRITLDSGAVIELNDPNARFSQGQSPDNRFSVDDQNPTVHAGTGYPMCIPRTVGTDGASTDAECPQVNRPKVDPLKGDQGCRTWTESGSGNTPAAGDISPPAPGQVYCSQFVMPQTPTTTYPQDATKQAPLEKGDFIHYSGTLMHDSTSDYISAHTVEANVGIYTQPGTYPNYQAIGEFGVGSADPNATSVAGTPQETQDRIFLEAETTDVKTAVDIYMTDVDPSTGKVHNRWITPSAMTGETTGGITTQWVGAQPQRIRIRATKAPTGVLVAPSRNIRVANRKMCDPTVLDQTPGGALDACLNNDGTAGQTKRPLMSNGLLAGEYTAPTFEFIFPENVKPGDGMVPNDLWHLPFLISGDTVGPLSPTPW